MKKRLLLLLLPLLLFGCARQEVYQFTGVVEEVYENSIFVTSDDPIVGDRASVGFAKDMKPLSFNLAVGQTLTITILPDIRDSYPVQVTAVKIELITDKPTANVEEIPKESMDTEKGFETISPEEAKGLMDSNTDCIVLDVRAADEYAQGHIPGAVLLPDNEIASRAQEVLQDKDALILVYCRSGRRSALAAAQLAELGYTQIKNFGGIINWPYEITSEQ